MTRAFYGASEFDWLGSVDQQFDKIREELANFSVTNPVYQSYVEPIGKGAAGGFWDVASLVFFAINNPAVIEMAPHTASVIPAIPGLVTMQILDLGPNTHLRAHCGYSPDTLRFHLGMIVPEPDKYSLRVENEHRHWEEGEWLIFDDYLEHEVWNRGEQSRKVLLIDAVRPGVGYTPQEVARRFFNNADGTNFDGLLSKVAPRKQWLEWVENGEFR